MNVNLSIYIYIHIHPEQWCRLGRFDTSSCSSGDAIMHLSRTADLENLCPIIWAWNWLASDALGTPSSIANQALISKSSLLRQPRTGIFPVAVLASASHTKELPVSYANNVEVGNAVRHVDTIKLMPFQLAPQQVKYDCSRMEISTGDTWWVYKFTRLPCVYIAGNSIDMVFNWKGILKEELLH